MAPVIASWFVPNNAAYAGQTRKFSIKGDRESKSSMYFNNLFLRQQAMLVLSKRKRRSNIYGAYCLGKFSPENCMGRPGMRGVSVKTISERSNARW